MVRLACVLGVVVGLAVSAVATYRPQAQPVVRYRAVAVLSAPSAGDPSERLPDIPFFMRELPDGRKIECHPLSHSLPVLCIQGRWYMSDGTDTAVAK